MSFSFNDGQWHAADRGKNGGTSPEYKTAKNAYNFNGGELGSCKASGSCPSVCGWNGAACKFTDGENGNGCFEVKRQMNHGSKYWEYWSNSFRCQLKPLAFAALFSDGSHDGKYAIFADGEVQRVIGALNGNGQVEAYTPPGGRSQRSGAARTKEIFTSPKGKHTYAKMANGNVFYRHHGTGGWVTVHTMGPIDVISVPSDTEAFGGAYAVSSRSLKKASKAADGKLVWLNQETQYTPTATK